MINNFDIIKNLLVFPHQDSFYFLQVLQRKKDHPNLGNNSRVIKTYYITSVEYLENHMDEIITLSDAFNARAMINLNPRSFRKTGFAVLRKIADQMGNDDFFSIRKSYDSVCGEYQSEIDKRWLVDIDSTDPELIAWVEMKINELHASHPTYEILAKIPSKSGVHIISNPFNMDKFGALYPDIDVHKNNPTSLYIPKKTSYGI